ncbi:hypothetical protein [Cellulomonas sp. NTE-D12]|uniref:hypothetical protein n=1 Tax=Cellulomonas sp. NTE-D12 TaxID=2962632 RepID=UPI003081E2CA|nr:hypothetical protein CELD12_18090 [Cellulomonas sp. NTE-D12]
MRRLFWVGVGVALTVVVVRQGRALLERYAPPEATAAVAGAGRLARAAEGARREFAAGFAERERALREALVGDVDVDKLRAEAPARRAALRETFGGRHAAPPEWAENPTEDPDDDDGYAFF